MRRFSEMMHGPKSWQICHSYWSWSFKNLLSRSRTMTGHMNLRFILNVLISNRLVLCSLPSSSWRSFLTACSNYNFLKTTRKRLYISKKEVIVENDKCIIRSPFISTLRLSIHRFLCWDVFSHVGVPLYHLSTVCMPLKFSFLSQARDCLSKVKLSSSGMQVQSVPYFLFFLPHTCF